MLWLSYAYGYNAAFSESSHDAGELPLPFPTHVDARAGACGEARFSFSRDLWGGFCIVVWPVRLCD